MQIFGRTRYPGTRTKQLNDSFLTAEAAPLTSPRSAEPGPGTLTIVDTENKLSISGGQLVCSGGKATPATGDPGVWGAAHTVATGLAAIFSVTPGATDKTMQVGWDDGQTGALRDGIALQSDGNFDIVAAGTSAGELGAYTAVEHKFAIIPWSGGANIFVKGGGYADWTFVYRTADALVSTSYPAIANNNAAFTADYIRTAQLPAPFDTDYGLATDQLAGARTAGDTFTHEADGHIEFTATTVPSSGSIFFNFRIQDSSNLWYVRVISTGDLRLYEKVAGSDTQRGAAAGVIANGDRIVIIMDDEEIRVYEANNLRITYSSAANFKTATDGRLNSEGTGGSVSDIVTWPRTYTGNVLDGV